MKEYLTVKDMAIMDNHFLRDIKALRRLGAYDEAEKRLALRNKVLDLLTPHVKDKF